jgi:hypothetical protein
VKVTWEQALADIEAGLDALEAQLDNGETPQLEFVVPDIDGELPAALVGRVQAAGTRGDALRARAESRARDIRAELQRIPRRRPQSATTSLFEIGV